MPFTIVMLPPQSDLTRSWGQRLASDVPGATVVVAEDAADAAHALPGADAAFGTLPADLLRHAPGLRWLQAPMGGPPPGYYHPDLVNHPVTVTNLRGTYTDHVATHALAMLLALARGLHRYAAQQARGVWESDWDPGAVLPLAESTVLIVGVGAIGTELTRLLEPFGGPVIGTDARRTEPPAGMRELHPAGALDLLLPDADAVVLTVPHTPSTERLMARQRLDLIKPSAFLVNVGRGPLVDLDDLVSALRDRRLRGAALDVFPEEPLPSGHPLWTTPGVLITPHVAGVGPHWDERRYEVLAENARRFGAGQPLINVVDKAAWF